MPFISPPKRALLSAPLSVGWPLGRAARRLWLGFFIKGECSRGLARFRAAAAGLPPLFICRGPLAAADAHRTLPCKGLASGGHTWPKTAGNELSASARRTSSFQFFTAAAPEVIGSITIHRQATAFPECNAPESRRRRRFCAQLFLRTLYTPATI
jgi:hypothetical protein